jgi:uncharacterized membrane protein
MMTLRDLHGEALLRIEDAIVRAGWHTSAPIKIVVVGYCWSDIRARAQALFHEHGLHRTKDRNGVLILVVLVNREFVIFGDRGLDDRVDEGFWLRVRDTMREHFQAGDIVPGLFAGAELVARELGQHFPPGGHEAHQQTSEAA